MHHKLIESIKFPYFKYLKYFICLPFIESKNISLNKFRYNFIQTNYSFLFFAIAIDECRMTLATHLHFYRQEPP